MSTCTARRLTVLGVLAATGLAACGSHHHAAAPAATTPSSAPSSSSSTTPKAAPRPTGPLAPLTGLVVSARAARRPAVVVKIDNVAQALPQTGINQADVVYEEMVEGGLTRLAVVFASQQPTVVGPVRSGRLTDEGIADDLNHPVLAYAGTNALFQPQLAAQPLSDITDDVAPSLFVRNNSRVPPHNYYTNVAGLAALDDPSTAPEPLWAFRAAGTRFQGKGATTATGMTIPFPAAQIQWSWDKGSQQWLRTQNGAPDTETGPNGSQTGPQLSARNVIVEFIPYITSAYVTGEGTGADGSAIPTGEQVGQGVAWFFSGGRVVVGTWTRSSLTSRTVYADASGTPIRLEPGRTWVELPPTGTSVTVTP